uniref:V-type proton ATPase subunit C n=1 Tax=Tetraodon nigroviridis TaxID=99883 RepID=H3CHR2_TETNG
MCQDVLQVAKELKSRSAAYNSGKASLQSLERKLDGTLQNCSLTELIRKEDLVVSEYLTTLLVFVPRRSYAHWESTYECLSDLVVPRSSRKLLEDKEGGIFAVTLFKKAVCDFKGKAQENKFFVREYCLDLPSCEFKVFVHWLKVHFSQLSVAWIHLKALRVFVELALRYGLPVRYQALLLQADRKQSKRLEDELAYLFGYLDPTATASKAEVWMDGWI